MNTQSLIASAPAELVLQLSIVFGLAVIILFALSWEAGNYRDLTQWLRDTGSRLSPKHYRRRWHFNVQPLNYPNPKGSKITS